VAVEAFLSERIRFTDIARVVEMTLSSASTYGASLEAVLAADAEARARAAGLL
jgi:1-deoxy-D-xylulose-5-phosphate reductoisomerase